MLIYPAIDLRGGQVVRLLQGDYAQETRYPLEPVALAAQYAQAGAQWLHVVDLDGARDARQVHSGQIARIAALAGLKVQSGGGVRERADVDRLLDSGVRRVVVGSSFVRSPETVGRWIEDLGADALCIALDVRGHDGRWQVQAAGWREDGGWTLEAALETGRVLGARHFLVTDIGRDGMLAGPALALYRELRRRFPEARLQASGGVSSLADLAELRQEGVAGVIVGKALLEGRFTLNAALAAGERPC